MSFFSSPLFGRLAMSAVGGILGNKGARDLRGNITDANIFTAMPYLDARDYLTDAYKDMSEGYKGAKDAGFYTGDTRAAKWMTAHALVSMLVIISVQEQSVMRPGSWMLREASPRIMLIYTIAHLATCLAMQSIMHPQMPSH